MKLGPLQFGWDALDESDRIRLGLDPWPTGWEVFFIEWRGRGAVFCARTRRGMQEHENE